MTRQAILEIADAVNISAKTVLVYFPSNEGLVFDGEDEERSDLSSAPTGLAR
ncbi:MAG TPA: hypothetical protein VHW44_17460 [Pseudonocardiaceae bacterium]|jgi:hypothetical protein|nr:hypothetical protein [Pseudonocardiaceae bacterium]